MNCFVCGYDAQDESSGASHEASPRHQCNLILHHFKRNKKFFSSNRDGIFVICNARTEKYESAPPIIIENCDKNKVRLYAKPKQRVKFFFNIRNDMKKEDVLIVGAQLAHPQPQFEVTYNPYIFGEDAHNLTAKTTIPKDILVTFAANDIGLYEMPIMFTFYRPSVDKNIVIVREMVVNVQVNPIDYVSHKTPYDSKEWTPADSVYYCDGSQPMERTFKIPKMLKLILPKGLDDSILDDFQDSPEIIEEMRIVLASTRRIIEEGTTKDNYVLYFHHLLWWEEIIEKINMRKYNMSGVTLSRVGNSYILVVPGLAEKRPSLLRGDRVFIRPQQNVNVIFESTVTELKDTFAHIGKINPLFSSYYTPEAKFDIHFLMSRVPMERKHAAVSRLFSSTQVSRVFPTRNENVKKAARINRFYNKSIKENQEQRCAVEHIVSGTSGKAPYMVFGPPGTGKTVTIVEAIIQLVVKNPQNRILVCTGTNMAADHIALTLLQYNKQLNVNNFLLRANSQMREWSVLPQELVAVSNGSSYENYYSVSDQKLATYRIVVMTLLHAEKYVTPRNLRMSHLFIDEAAQACEPSCLVPITGLLAKNGHLVLAGDPQQLGPVCMSRNARDKGLGTSLMERLLLSYSNMYENNPNYITMLVNNFRSHPDILKIPNELSYKGRLKACAPLDSLSGESILGTKEGRSAVVFHAVHAREQKMGSAPGYYNEQELDMLKRYVLALLKNHRVEQTDIGIISPYIRQVYKMKIWLSSNNFKDIEIGTVEAFQGKEKRVILVSAVRANNKLLDYDAKYGIGFLVDDKRYNVTLTRAKSKLIIIGNPTCLKIDTKWRKYMDLCKDRSSYLGADTEQVDRTTALLEEISKTRFQKCRLYEELKAK